ncbi:hypothetical protein [Pimelobacter simplex]|uniref:hypothetical protein n=1 Tax=Nocardioides simplex TaxID=2045 RepID=UPI0019329875|nr:hypothetical protein [Pimelobacter simplex]
MAALSDAMAAAEDETNLFEYVRQVKSAVVRSVEELDPTVKIHDTGHFNHSAAPDLVLSWPDRPGERPLYVRRSYDELAAGRDVQRLAEVAPIFLSVGRRDDGDRSETLQRLGVTQSENRSVLVTNAATVDMFTGSQENSTSPLTGAVAAAILPTGQGLVDQETAAPVLDGAADVLTQLSEVLNAEGLSRVTTVAAVVSAAHGAELPTTSDDAAPFSMQEARELLPWLLRSEGVTDNAEFWRFIAARVTVQHLEALAAELDDVELSSLCNQGISTWQAKGATLGLSMRAQGDDNAADGWFMRAGLLSYETGDAAFRFPTLGYTLKKRGGVSSATWEAIQGGLGDARLMQIVLRGLARSIRIDAEESGDAQVDTNAILSSVEDQYYIDQVTLRYGLAEEERLIRVMFGDQIAHNDGSANVRDLLLALARVGAYRNPVDLTHLAE